MITRSNYESWMIDYMDGNLTPSERMLLLDFLNEHDDLKEELSCLKPIPLNRSDSPTYSRKDDLKVDVNAVPPINTHNYEEYMISSLEGQLCASDQERLEKFIAENPTTETDFQLLKQTVLSPPTVSYMHKADLYQEATIIAIGTRAIRNLKWVAVAASMLLGGLFMVDSWSDRQVVPMSYAPAALKQYQPAYYAERMSFEFNQAEVSREKQRNISTAGFSKSDLTTRTPLNAISLVSKSTQRVAQPVIEKEIHYAQRKLNQMPQANSSSYERPMKPGEYVLGKVFKVNPTQLNKYDAVKGKEIVEAGVAQVANELIESTRKAKSQVFTRKEKGGWVLRIGRLKIKRK